MKTRNWIALLTLLLVSGLPAVASEPSKQAHPKHAAKAKAPKKVKDEQVALTGSYIKRNIHRNGIVTDGPNPVFVVDNEAIQNSGAADLRQLLLFRGVRR
jgi:hypothetical protein